MSLNPATLRKKAARKRLGQRLSVDAFKEKQSFSGVIPPPPFPFLFLREWEEEENKHTCPRCQVRADWFWMTKNETNFVKRRSVLLQRPRWAGGGGGGLRIGWSNGI